MHMITYDMSILAFQYFFSIADGMGIYVYMYPNNFYQQDAIDDMLVNIHNNQVCIFDKYNVVFVDTWHSMDPCIICIFILTHDSNCSREKYDIQISPP